MQKSTKNMKGLATPMNKQTTTKSKAKLNNMLRVICAFLLCLGMLFSMSGCTLIDKFSEQPTDPDEIAKINSEKYSPQGSAAFLEGDVVLVSVFLSEKGDAFTDEEIDYAKSATDIASNWIEEQGKNNGHQVTIHRNSKDLVYKTSNTDMAKNSTSDNIDDYYNYAINYINDKIDTKKLLKKYDAKSIGYVFIVNETSTSYANPYDQKLEVISDAKYTADFCTVFMYNKEASGEYENPATYAHEILHLFGAEDLYEENSDYQVGQKMVSYVESNYPNDIMYYTYEDDNSSNYTSISKILSPITLYNIGWGDGGTAIKLFPEMTRQYKCAF